MPEDIDVGEPPEPNFKSLFVRQLRRARQSWKDAWWVSIIAAIISIGGMLMAAANR